MSASADTERPPAVAVAVCLLAVYLIWGSTYLAIRYAIESMPPMLMAGARFVTAGAVMFVFLRLRGVALPAFPELRNAAGIGVLLLAGGNGCVTVAEQWVSSSIAAAMVASGGIWSVVFLAMLDEKVSPAEWLGVALAFAGVILLNVDGDLQASPFGAALLIGATLSWATGSVLSRRIALPQGAMAASVEMLAGGAALLLVAAMLGEQPTAVTTVSLVAWLYLVVFGSVVAFSAFTYLIRNVRPALATSYAYVNPAVALLLGVLVAGESVGTYGYAGVAVIVAGVAALTLARAGGKPATVPEMPCDVAAPLDEEAA